MLSSNEPGRRVQCLYKSALRPPTLFFRQMDLVWNNLQVVVMRHLRTWANLQGQLSVEYEKDAKCKVWQNGARNPQLLLEKTSQELLDAFGLNDPNF